MTKARTRRPTCLWTKWMYNTDQITLGNLRTGLKLCWRCGVLILPIRLSHIARPFGLDCIILATDVHIIAVLVLFLKLIACATVEPFVFSCEILLFRTKRWYSTLAQLDDPSQCTLFRIVLFECEPQERESVFSPQSSSSSAGALVCTTGTTNYCHYGTYFACKIFANYGTTY